MDWQKIRLWLALLALVGLSISGLWGVGQEWHYSNRLLAMSSTFMQTLYSVFGLAALPALLLRSRSARPLLYLWAFTLVLTGATAPVIWGSGGWWAGFFAACMMAVVAGLVIWLAPLPVPGELFRRWRWGVVAMFGAATLVVLYVTANNVITVTEKLAPVALGGERMERFCEGLRQDLTHDELRALVDTQGYSSKDASDAKGTYLRIDDPTAPGSYHCEARFKPDGSLASVNFTAKAQH